MKQSENNEIDNLLRGLASRERSAPSGLAENVTGAHLDADELNSYAEGALPPATRTRYASHLADCNDCRKIATQLSIAASPLIHEIPISHPATGFDWRKMLAALFAPAVLRYAMPAIALIVIGVAFFASRQQRQERLALNSEKSSVSTVTQPHAELPKGASNQPPQGEGQTRASGPSATPASGVADKAGDKAEKAADTAKPESSAANSEKEAAKNETDAVTQPTYAPEPAPPPAAAKAAPATETKDSPRPVSALAELKPSAARKREADKQGENSRQEASDESSTSGGAPAEAQAAGKDDDRKKAKTVNAARGAVERRDEESETRTVGGRHFQRRNNIWVDAAYNSSLSIANVSRGSEQYRALIADEPGIDAIARQLSGEVILVWKGRAYRIR